ncbi:glycine cleavage system protein GcvH [Zhaonella formicivorans]|uniref:glycine cleavage system protein GcvH n=1 Tax=Zhaonella formicivorans TaxID=2528593 RepID=UPI0010DE3D8F|nr:glycine cleavage system protein GcvH [Zhaonella formicivorans]
MYPSDRKYTKDHEWLLVTGEEAAIGITSYAQEALGDVVYVELPGEDDTLEEGKSFGVIESVKAVSDVYSPVDGEVIAVNEALLDSPELLNEDPYDTGWMVRIRLTKPEQVAKLMTSEQYADFLKEGC